MQYIIIPIFLLFAYYAYKKQQSFKGEFKDIDFYGAESMEIARSVIKEEVLEVSCAMNRNTENKAMWKAVGMQHLTKTTSGDFKHFDYYVVARTKEELYFIPVRIKGTTKYYLAVNTKMQIESYPIEKVKNEIVKEKLDAMMPYFDVKFHIDEVEHFVQFYGKVEKYQRLITV